MTNCCFFSLLLYDNKNIYLIFFYVCLQESFQEKYVLIYYCLMPNEQFLRYIMVRTNYIFDDNVCTRLHQYAELDLYSTSSLKQQSAVMMYILDYINT